MLGRFLITFATCVALTGMGGCGQKKFTPRDDATVKGTVRVSGKLATGGEVVFDATAFDTNTQRAAPSSVRAPISKDGTYFLTTTSGKNSVIILYPIRRGNQQAIGNTRPGELNYEVKPGENSIDIDVTLPPANTFNSAVDS